MRPLVKDAEPCWNLASIIDIMEDDLDVTEAVLLDNTTTLLYVGQHSAEEGLTEEDTQDCNNSALSQQLPRSMRSLQDRDISQSSYYSKDSDLDSASMMSAMTSNTSAHEE